MRHLLALVFAALVGAVLVAPAGAQEAPPIEAQIALQPSVATIGDRVRVVVTATHADNIIVTVIPPAMVGVDLISTATPPPVADGLGGVVTTVEFVVQPFSMGEINLGQFRLNWLREDGVSGNLRLTVPALPIISVRAEGDTALRPLKPQAVAPGAPPAWIRPAMIATPVVLLLLALTVIVVWWRTRPRRMVLEEAPDLTPERAARARLDRLRGLRLAGEGEFQAYYGEIALVVRGYLEQRFDFNASALTTPELEARMTAYGVDRWQARLVGGLLDRCDRAVYARHYPDPASADHDLTVAYEIVELSRPVVRQAQAVSA